MTSQKQPDRRAALYARVSTRNGHQDPAVQLQALREVAGRAGWQVVDTYVDDGISGTKARDRRPEFDRLLKDATRRRFDLVAAWSVDRLGRSLQDLVAFLADLKATGCDLYLHVQAVDTTTPAGKALFQMLGVFAEFERAIIQERIHAGIAKARVTGTKSGKPHGRPGTGTDAWAKKLGLKNDGQGAELVQAIRSRAAAGESKRAIGRTLGVPESTVRKVLAQPLRETGN